MQTKALSKVFATNAIKSHSDAFVSIGDGLEVLLPSDAQDGDSWLVTLEPYKTPKPLVFAIQGREVFVTSKVELLSQIQNNLVLCPNSTKQTLNLPNQTPTIVPDHRSDMLVSYFNHLFLVKGRTLWWTDLDNVWEWQPHPHNEADFRQIEWESLDATGLVRAGDRLYLHFPNAIYDIEYVGKPTIVKIELRVHGIGSVTPRALVVHNTVQFFIGTDNFYAWSYQTGLNAIGGDVWKKFKKSIGNINDVWAYVDQKNNEICWVDGLYIWAFNFLEKSWHKYSADGILAHQTIAWSTPPPALDETLSIIEPVIPSMVENVWVTQGAICREQGVSDDLSRCLPMTTPFLESDDITYGDLHFVKRVDLVMLDMKLSFPWSGVRVKISGRDYVSHPNRWVDCGVWDQNAKEKQLDFKAVSGKVLKFRFELVDCLDWNGLLPNGGLSLNGKRLDIANGEIIMDGSRSDFLARQVQMFDGFQTLDELDTAMSLNFAELNAWGERVDLPQVLIGPDK